MDELKKMLVGFLCNEYTIEDATEQIENAEIVIKNNTIRVNYDNGKSDLLKLVITKKLVAVQ